MKKLFKTWRHRRRMKWCIQQARMSTNEQEEITALAEGIYKMLYALSGEPSKPIRSLPQIDREVFAGKCHQAAAQLTALLEQKNDFGVDVHLYHNYKNNTLECRVKECREL